MSKYLAYLPLTGYLRQWAVNHYGDPIEFPCGSSQNAAIRVMLTRRRDGEEPDVDSEGCVGLVLPDSKAKPVSTFNHLTDEGKKAVASMLQDLLSVQLWGDLRPLLTEQGTIISGMKALTVIRNWCKQNGIDPEYDNTIKQKWYRQRECHGINQRIPKSQKHD